MTCPICGRLYCDHSPAERGQTMEDMLADMSTPHIVDDKGITRKVSQAERDQYIGKPKKNYEDKRKYK